MWTSRWKVTVPHEDFIDKLNARYAFLELGIEDGNCCQNRF
jgi:isocitrate lyase